MGKTKYAINAQIRDFVVRAIVFLEENKKDLEAYKVSMIPSAIPKYGPQTGGFNPEQRPTEDSAVKLASDIYIFQLQLSISAVEGVYSKLTDLDKELVRLKYWNKGELTDEGIALKLNMDRATMYRHLNVIIIEVAKRLGYLNI